MYLSSPSPFSNFRPVSTQFGGFVAGGFGVQSNPFTGAVQGQSWSSLGALWQASQGLGQSWAGILGGSYGGVGYQGGAQAGAYGQFAGYGQQQYGGFGQYGNHGQYGGYGQQGGYGYQGGGVGVFGGVNVQVGYQEIPGETQKMWDVWFDSKDGQKTVQRSPIVLDLNKNGKADITGKNITGDGKIDGPTVMFDLDPNNISYEFKSEQRRPGSGAPDVKGGYWVDAEGNKVKSGPPKGKQPKFNGYQYMDKDGKLVGEMKDGLYNYGKQEKREITEWLAKDGGDGFLVADLDGDGQINSAVELFGTEGANGEKYANGFDKLAALYDKNGDGKVTGNELQGLQVWVDKNADGVVQDGELQSLQEHNITSLDAKNYDPKTMEGSFTEGGGVAPYMQVNGYVGAYAYGYGGQGQYGNYGNYGNYGGYGGYGGYSQPYFPGNYQARPGGWGY